MPLEVEVQKGDNIHIDFACVQSSFTLGGNIRNFQALIRISSGLYIHAQSGDYSFPVSSIYLEWVSVGVSSSCRDLFLLRVVRVKACYATIHCRDVRHNNEWVVPTR